MADDLAAGCERPGLAQFGGAGSNERDHLIKDRAQCGRERVRDLVVGVEGARRFCRLEHTVDPGLEMWPWRDQLTLRPGVAAEMRIERSNQAIVAKRGPVSEEKGVMLEMVIESVELYLREAVDDGSQFRCHTDRARQAAHQPGVVVAQKIA